MQDTFHGLRSDPPTVDTAAFASRIWNASKRDVRKDILRAGFRLVASLLSRALQQYGDGDGGQGGTQLDDIRSPSAAHSPRQRAVSGGHD